MPSSLPLLHTAMLKPCLNAFRHSDPYIFSHFVVNVFCLVSVKFFWVAYLLWRQTTPCSRCQRSTRVNSTGFSCLWRKQQQKSTDSTEKSVRSGVRCHTAHLLASLRSVIIGCSVKHWKFAVRLWTRGTEMLTHCNFDSRSPSGRLNDRSANSDFLRGTVRLSAILPIFPLFLRHGRAFLKSGTYGSHVIK